MLFGLQGTNVRGGIAWDYLLSNYEASKLKKHKGKTNSQISPGLTLQSSGVAKFWLLIIYKTYTAQYSAKSQC